MPTVDAVDDVRPRPFWSVMIPTYNRADLLAETLASVLAQDPGPERMQIEVVDDGSTRDDPAAVVDALGAGRVTLVRHPRNLGASATFTTCARRARGRWVHTLHSDDVVRVGFYAAYEDAISTCPDAVLVGARTTEIDQAGTDGSLTGAVEVSAGYLRNAHYVLASANPLRCVSAVVSRDAYTHVGGFHPGLFHACDWEMWARLASAGPVAWVQESLGRHRQHDQSDTRQLHARTRYLDDCLLAASTISAQVGPDQQTHTWLAARRYVAEYGLAVATECLAVGRWRLAAINAVRAAQIDPHPEVLLRARTTVTKAVAGRLRRAAAEGQPP